MRVSVSIFIMMVGLAAFGHGLAQEAPRPPEAAGEQSQQGSQMLPGQRLSHWIRQAGQAYERQDVEGWVEATEELHQLRPFNQDFMRHLVEGYARLDNLSEAFNMMLKMQQQGLSVDWDQIDAVEPLREHGLYSHLNDLMAKAGEAFGDVTIWSRLDSKYAMPEAMAHDDKSGRLFVGTIRDGLILTSKDGEDWQAFASPETVPQIQGIFDLAVDAQRGHLWVASSAVGQYQGPPRDDDVHSSLLRLDLESGELQAEYELSSGAGRNLLGSLALAADGTVFAADTQAPVIYRLDPGSHKMKTFFGHQNFTSLRGLALNDDDSLLYLADYELGIFVVDVSGGEQAWQLAIPETFNAGGIDGLFWWDDHLIAIQNSITPQRVVRLALGDDGLGVTAVAPLAAAQEEFDTPTFGVMDEQNLYFFAASHWQYVDTEGRVRGELPEVPIMTIDVDNASVQVVGQEVMEQMQRQQQGQGESGN